jgi:hypothetical protein
VSVNLHAAAPDGGYPYPEDRRYGSELFRLWCSAGLMPASTFGLGIEGLLLDHIPALEAEMLCGGEEVFIV